MLTVKHFMEAEEDRDIYHKDKKLIAIIHNYILNALSFI